MALEIRPIRKSEIGDALDIHANPHAGQWKDSHLVISREILEKQVKNNGKYQIGAFYNGKLLAVVTTARFNIGNVDHSRLEVTHADKMPTGYNKIAHSTDPNGNALGCFIISKSREKDLIKKIESETGKTIADHLLGAVKARAERDPFVEHLVAVSTPVGLGKYLGKDNLYTATMDEAVAYVKKGLTDVKAGITEGIDPVLFKVHYKLGAKPWKIVVRDKERGWEGRPFSEDLSGNGVIVFMRYNLEKKGFAALVQAERKLRKAA